MDFISDWLLTRLRLYPDSTLIRLKKAMFAIAVVGKILCAISFFALIYRNFSRNIWTRKRYLEEQKHTTDAGEYPDGTFAVDDMPPILSTTLLIGGILGIVNGVIIAVLGHWIRRHVKEVLEERTNQEEASNQSS